MTDEEIVELIQRGEKEKFGEIIDRYQGKLSGYVRNMINQEREEVEDVVEESLIKAYENILDFEPTKRFSSWIYRIAHNQAVDYIKKKRLKRQEIEGQEEILADKEKLLIDLEIEKEQKREVGEAVGKLEIKYREVVLLYYFEEKSYEEISDILRIPVNNVGVLLHRAKVKLKQTLTPTPFP